MKLLLVFESRSLQNCVWYCYLISKSGHQAK